jgi:GntR family transcriptional repressor for pyruvate dehydrogenase complex
MILSGELKPADQLPNELNLARDLGVSRAAVREALRTLRSMGLVERSKGGTFIKRVDWSILDAPLDCLLTLRPQDLHDLYDCRRVLEEATTVRAATRATQDELNALEVCLDRMANSASMNEKFVEANFAFHHQIAVAAHNEILLRLFESLTRPIKQVQLTASYRPQAIPTSLGQHRQIYEALAARDPERARKAVLHHLEHIEKAFGPEVSLPAKSEGPEGEEGGEPGV